MKKTMIILLSALAVLGLAAALTPQQAYIEKYASTAVREMYRSGVPASITLAQGLLESRYGLSELASKGNNHFGIKCHSNWKGKTMKVDDDRKGECFRVYSSADESFRDHSDFLRYSDRYKFLFEYQVTDYESWAHGLKKAGYATDPQYASKLIKLIEDYDLGRYDKVKDASEVASSDSGEKDEELSEGRKQEEKASGSDKASKKQTAKEKRRARKSRVEEENTVIPESPLSIEEAVPVSKENLEEFHFNLSRQMYSKNGVPFLYAVEGETFASIAASNHLFLKEILRFNDLDAPQELLPGTVVYLQAKKKQSPKGLDKYVVEQDGEQLRDICQRFGVQMKSIMKYNGFTSRPVLREGDMILLRKP